MWVLDMDIPWLGITIGIVSVGFIQLVRILARRRLISDASPGRVTEQAPRLGAERIRYLLWGLCFPFSLVPAIWFSADSSRTSRQVVGIMYGLMAVAWVVLGLIPFLWAARGGRSNIDEYRRRVEHHSRSRFSHLVVIWWAAIAVMLFASLRNLFF